MIKWTRTHTAWALVIAALVGAAGWDWLLGVVEGARVLTDVIRVDLDDLTGIDLIGVAAIITAIGSLRRGRRTEAEVRKNGYVEKADHQQALMEISLLKARLERIEDGDPFERIEDGDR